MSLFEFLMILLSIIVGLGLAELFSGIGQILKNDRANEFSWIHSALVAAIFLALLQTFWESWSLRTIEVWTFPAMLLMLASPVLLLTIAHILFPSESRHENLGEYYFENPVLPWRLATATVIVGTLFRPIAFGMPLFVVDNFSALPLLLICITLATTKNRKVHYVLAPVVTLAVALDTLIINYMIR